MEKLEIALEQARLSLRLRAAMPMPMSRPGTACRMPHAHDDGTQRCVATITQKADCVSSACTRGRALRYKAVLTALAARRMLCLPAVPYASPCSASACSASSSHHVLRLTRASCRASSCARSTAWTRAAGTAASRWRSASCGEGLHRSSFGRPLIKSSPLGKPATSQPTSEQRLPLHYKG